MPSPPQLHWLAGSTMTRFWYALTLMPSLHIFWHRPGGRSLLPCHDRELRFHESCLKPEAERTGSAAGELHRGCQCRHHSIP